jgi:hypothetical protein
MPCILAEIYRLFGGKCQRHIWFILGMEAVIYPKKAINFYHNNRVDTWKQYQVFNGSYLFSHAVC